MKAKELAFFGKISAGVTHDIKNVLAVINESNGLMADFMAMSREAPFPYREKFLRSIGKIQEQVNRGIDITSRFNRFAHSVDREIESIDLNIVVAQTVGLAERFARLKNIELCSEVLERRVMLATNHFRLQMCLTRAVEACTVKMNGGRIVLRVRNDNSPRMDIVAVNGSGECLGMENFKDCPEWLEFEELASSLNMFFDWDAASEGVLIGFDVSGAGTGKV